MKFSMVLREPKFANDLERDYTVNAMMRWDRNCGSVFLALASMTWVPVIIANEFGFINNPEYLVIMAYAVTQAAIAVALLIRKPPLKVMQGFIFSMMLMGQLVWTAAAIIDTADGQGSIMLAGLWIAYMFLGNLMMPLRSWAHNIIALVSIPTAIYGLIKFTNPDIGIALSILAIFLSQNVQIFSQRMMKVEAIRTFREKSKYIPRQVLMNAAKNDVSILNVFSPSDRYCVCICSDWSGKKSKAGKDVGKETGASLAEYYQHVVRLLAHKFPDGRYFMDWIADELFIVIFADSEKADPPMIREGFDLAVRMLDYRAEFARVHGFPHALHVGVSAGTSSVGVFGNGGIAKATAFGATPGQARRLVQFARKLSHCRGTKDRLVMNAEFASHLGLLRTTFTQVSTVGRLAVKDLDGQDVMVWPSLQEPERFDPGMEDTGIEVAHVPVRRSA